MPELGFSGLPRRNQQPARYYLTPALLIFATFVTFRRREMWELFEGSGADGEIKGKLLVWTALGLIALFRWRSVLKNSYLLFTLPLFGYVAFLFFAAVSSVYSLEPGLTLVRVGQLGIVVALGLSAADRADRWPLLASIYLALNWAFLLIGLTGHPASLNWRLLPGFQEAGYDGVNMPWRFGSPIGHFSIISIIAAMGAVSLAARLRAPPKPSEAAIFLWLVATVLITVSRTGMIGLILGLAVVIVLRGFSATAALAGTALISFVVMMPPVTQSVTEFLERGQDAEDLASLTGRSGIYEAALDSISEKWLIGHGFRASRVAKLNEITDSMGNWYGVVSHAHNAILESMASFGVLGGVLASFILLSIVGCAIGLLLRHSGSVRERGIEFTALLPSLFIFSVLDLSFAVEINPFVFMFIAFLIDVASCRAGVGRPSLVRR